MPSCPSLLFQKKKVTALQRSSYFGRTKAVIALLEAGADVNLVDVSTVLLPATYYLRLTYPALATWSSHSIALEVLSHACPNCSVILVCCDALVSRTVLYEIVAANALG